MENKTKTREDIIKALNWRYAVKEFDKEKKVAEEDIYTILESARLSPSSLGLEPWKFLVIKNPEIRTKLFEVSNQSKVLDASHLIIITYRTDVAENIARERLERTAKIQNKKIEDFGGLKNMLEGAITAKKSAGTLESWIRSQAYIPLGMMIETASLLGVDDGPMEGFKAEEVDKILGLKDKNLKSVSMLALGYRGKDPASTRPKVRRTFEEVVEFI